MGASVLFLQDPSCRNELGDLEAAHHWDQIVWTLVVREYGPQTLNGGLNLGRDTLVLPSDLPS